jgi:hypothetical protein
MGFFDSGAAQDAYGQVYDERTPHAKWSHELLAGAAGYEAMRKYEKHRESEGITGRHEEGKEIIAGLAAAEADKLVETRGVEHLDRERARRQSAEQAQYLYDRQYQ